MNLETIWESLKALCKKADELIPGTTGKEKKQWCIDKALQFLNITEMLIGIGAWANLAIVDGFERFLLGLGVERAWVELQLPA